MCGFCVFVRAASGGADFCLHDQDALTAQPFRNIKATVEKELKQPLTALFSNVDQTPLATASIAQVSSCSYILRTHLDS